MSEECKCLNDDIYCMTYRHKVDLDDMSTALSLFVDPFMLNMFLLILLFQGIPLKYESSIAGQSAIKHNVKSLLTSPGKLDEPKIPERVRHTSVVSSTSVLRSTHQEASKTQLSPGMYEDANARRTPNYPSGSISRGSPLLRTQEGISVFYFDSNSKNLKISFYI